MHTISNLNPLTEALWSPVVVATWPVWVVDRAESLDVPPNVVLHFQGKGRAVGVVITDDADRCGILCLLHFARHVYS